MTLSQNSSQGTNYLPECVCLVLHTTDLFEEGNLTEASPIVRRQQHLHTVHDTEETLGMWIELHLRHRDSATSLQDQHYHPHTLLLRTSTVISVENIPDDSQAQTTQVL